MRLVQSWLAFLVVAVLVPVSTLAGEKRPLIYEPVPTETTRSYFANGQPFAIVTQDSSVVMLVMNPEKIGHYKYFRVWCLYYNNGSEPVLFDPAKMASLVSTKIAKGDFQQLKPEPPTEILERISDDMANKEILRTIGGAIAGLGQAMSAQPTTVTGSGNAAGSSWTANDLQEKQRAVNEKAAQRTVEANQRARTAYDFYSRSVSAGILRRNTVFPGTGVNGYIYFPATKSYNAKFAEYSHVVALRLPHDEVKVAFNPAAGE